MNTYIESCGMDYIIISEQPDKNLSVYVDVIAKLEDVENDIFNIYLTTTIDKTSIDYLNEWVKNPESVEYKKAFEDIVKCGKLWILGVKSNKLKDTMELLCENACRSWKQFFDFRATNDVELSNLMNN